MNGIADEQIITAEIIDFVKVNLTTNLPTKRVKWHKSIGNALKSHSKIFFFEMLFHFLSIISLVRGAKGGEDVPIPHCNKQVTVGRDVRQRTTVDPQLCARMDTPACDAIFDIKGRPVDADGIAATMQSHSNP